jgi:hypothetical protein
MTHVGPAPLGVSAPSTGGASFVEWGACSPAQCWAAAITFVCFLRSVPPLAYRRLHRGRTQGSPPKSFASLAVFWAMAAQIAPSFMVGGYVAGRMRSRWHETTEHEVEFRDGLHTASSSGPLARGHRCRIVRIGSRDCGKDRRPDRRRGDRLGGRFHERPDGRATGYDDTAYNGRSSWLCYHTGDGISHSHTSRSHGRR